MRTKKTSFGIEHHLGLGWDINISVNDPKALKEARKHLNRVLNRGLIGDYANYRYDVYVETKWFGLVHKYTLV